MTAFDEIRSQETAVRTLERALGASRLASAYLFVGPSGVGKEKTALAVARASIASEDADVQRRIHDGRHPDVRVVRPREQGAGNIPVEVVRSEILPFAQFAPFEAGTAFLIFPEADVSFPESHPEGANALLKTLEETRPGVHFLLLSERPDRLLPTIRSRCQKVSFGRLPADVLDTILETHGVADEPRRAAVALADGRADRALELASGETGRRLLELAMRVDETVAQGGPGDLVDTAAELAHLDRLPLALETLATFYRDIACAASGLADDDLAFRHVASSVRERAGRLDPGSASSRVERVRDTAGALERNANAEIALDSLLFRLRDLA